MATNTNSGASAILNSTAKIRVFIGDENDMAPRPLNSTIYFCKGEQTSRTLEFSDPDLGLLKLNAELVEDPKNTAGILEQLELTTNGTKAKHQVIT